MEERLISALKPGARIGDVTEKIVKYVKDTRPDLEPFLTKVSL